MRYRRYKGLALVAALFVVWRLPVPAQAITVDSLDCSGIDVADGNVEDWGNIPDLINTNESVEGTVHYLDSDTDEWTNVEPDNWNYSANLEQQANIQQMKVCNTDTFFMMLRTEEPMMFFYDKENDTYVDFWTRTEDMQNGFTLPADYHYWMVWQMQDANAEGSILYFAADLTMDEGRELGGGSDIDESDSVPILYIYEESEDVAYEDASFDPNQDTLLTEVEVSDDGQNVECDGESEDPECQPEEVEDSSDYAFEVSQDISELFQYADFNYGDTINMRASMYNSDLFSESSGLSMLSVVDSTDTEQYTFSQRAVRNLEPVSNSATDRSIGLKWRALKGAQSYQIKLLNPSNDQTVRVIKGVTKNRHTVRALKAGTTYRAVVRAVLKKNNGMKRFSAWSSGYRWTTEE